MGNSFFNPDERPSGDPLEFTIYVVERPDDGVYEAWVVGERKETLTVEPTRGEAVEELSRTHLDATEPGGGFDG